jgi:hypothetical protein
MQHFTATIYLDPAKIKGGTIEVVEKASEIT